MIPFQNRFHGHNSLSYVYKNGKTLRSDVLTLRFIKNPRRKDIRVAVVVGKKILKSAVGRNKIRRRVYEYIRVQLPKIKTVHDIVIIINSANVKTMPHKDLSQQIDKLLRDGGLFD